MARTEKAVDRSRPFRYWASCLQLPGELIQFLTNCERAVRVTYGTFARHADLRPLREEGHPAMYRISCKDNWAISFWRSEIPSGVQVYYFDWSRIEHIFVDRDVTGVSELEFLESMG